MRVYNEIVQKRKDNIKENKLRVFMTSQQNDFLKIHVK